MVYAYYNGGTVLLQLMPLPAFQKFTFINRAYTKNASTKVVVCQVLESQNQKTI